MTLDDLDAFVIGYVECAFWSTSIEDNDRGLLPADTSLTDAGYAAFDLVYSPRSGRTSAVSVMVSARSVTASPTSMMTGGPSRIRS